MEGLRDIKGIVEISGSPLYLLLTAVLVIILLFFIVKFFEPKKMKKCRKKAKELAYERLMKIDFSDTKMTVYSFSQNYVFFVDESNKSKFETLEKELEIYKYKKEIPNLTSEVEDEIKSLIKAIKW